MENKKILDLDQDELLYFASLYDAVYTSLREYYIKTNNFSKFQKFYKISEKIYRYINNNIEGENK